MVCFPTSTQQYIVGFDLIQGLVGIWNEERFSMLLLTGLAQLLHGRKIQVEIGCDLSDSGQEG
jgi:hypothetical protein